MIHRCHVVFLLVSLNALGIAWAGDVPQVAFTEKPGELSITIGDEYFGTYNYRDEVTIRPYFKYVHAPGGIQVTRSFPPVPGKDAEDHPTFHPGVWMAFGDISGHDYWRLKARIAHDGFVEKPKGGSGEGSFVTRNRYLTSDGRETVCTEIRAIKIVVRPTGYLMIWDSKFHSGTMDLNFGDQEEMGLAFRIFTPVAVDQHGQINDSAGRVNEPEVWGKRAAWCDYSGPVQGKYVGITMIPDPEIVGPCWWHARNTGFMAGNPFGCTSFGGEKKKVVVKKGDIFRLRYGLLFHTSASPADFDAKAAVADCLDQFKAMQ
jgi:hypothetical protein